MSLHLDKRQRAMLREIGVRVWQPAEPVAKNAEVLAEPSQVVQNSPVAATPVDSASPAGSERSARIPRVTSVPPPAQALRPVARKGGPAPWSLGEARALYAEAVLADGARWLVLAETPAAALQADPFQGDAGKLLDNMLRAARLNKGGVVLLAPLVRNAASGAPDFSNALSALVARAQPDVVLVMGRLAAQALLQSTEPFGKLRGQVHSLHGFKTVVTYDAAYLLRAPADKAKAWDDLQLAMSLAPGSLPSVP